MPKSNLTVYLDSDLIAIVKRKGNNVSETVETLLKIALNIPNEKEIATLYKCKTAILKMANALKNNLL